MSETTHPTPAGQPLRDFGVTVTDGSAQCLIVAVRGDFDLATVPAVRAAVEAALDAGSYDAVVLDLEATAFIDSCGIAYGLELAERFAAGRGLVVARPSARVERVLEIIRLPELRVAPSVSAALALLAAPAPR